MTDEHTPGRLVAEELDEDADYTFVIRQIDGDPYPLPVADCNRPADARRLVACWNALIDLPQEALDGGWTRAGLEAHALKMEQQAHQAQAQRDELLAERDALQARTATEFVEHQRELSKALDQRDELLAALTRIRALPVHPDAIRMAHTHAETAIAKVEGGVS